MQLAIVNLALEKGLDNEEILTAKAGSKFKKEYEKDKEFPFLSLFKEVTS